VGVSSMLDQIKTIFFHFQKQNYTQSKIQQHNRQSRTKNQPKVDASAGQTRSTQRAPTKTGEMSVL